jgi:hypothetical protein
LHNFAIRQCPNNAVCIVIQKGAIAVIYLVNMLAKKEQIVRMMLTAICWGAAMGLVCVDRVAVPAGTTVQTRHLDFVAQLDRINVGLFVAARCTLAKFLATPVRVF